VGHGVVGAEGRTPRGQDFANDGLDDAVEMGRRFDLRDDGLLAAAYAHLIDAGVYYFWNPRSNPVDRDSDLDGLYDEEELRGLTPGYTRTTNPLRWDTDGDWIADSIENDNGTDPNRVEPDRDLPPALASNYPSFTLFQPDTINEQGVYSRWILPEGANRWVLRSYNPNPVVFDVDTNLCVLNCDGIDRWVAATVGDDGETCDYTNIFNPCQSAEDVERRVIRDAIDAQGVYNRDGTVRRSFLATESHLICLTNTDDEYIGLCPTISEYREVASADVLAAPTAVATELGIIQLKKHETAEQAGTNGPNPQLSRKVRRRIFVVVAATLPVTLTGDARDRATNEVTKLCQDKRLRIMESVGAGWQNTPSGRRHPCEVMPIYIPGSATTPGGVSTVEPTRHVWDAITTRGRPVALQFARSESPGHETVLAAGWQRRYYPCRPFPTTGQDCDEYPYSSSVQMGPGLASAFNDPTNPTVPTPELEAAWAPWNYGGASLRTLDLSASRSAGNLVQELHAVLLSRVATRGRHPTRKHRDE
jgi:hypothetical protein